MTVRSRRHPHLRGLLRHQERHRALHRPCQGLRSLRRPDLDGDRQARSELAKQFAEAVKSEYPDQLLAYNCSPSFNWKQHLDDATIAKFQNELGAMGFKFQFITLAGFHALNYSMFDLAYGYAREQMKAYVDLQEREFAAESRGYTATKHQREVGAGYFDRIATTVDPNTSTAAPQGSTEEGQFH